MPKPELRPPAGHKSADVRVVAPINAGQQGGTFRERFLIAVLYFIGAPSIVALNAWLYSLSVLWYWVGLGCLVWFAVCWFFAGVTTGDVGPRV